MELSLSNRGCVLSAAFIRDNAIDPTTHDSITGARNAASIPFALLTVLYRTHSSVIIVSCYMVESRNRVCVAARFPS